MKNLDPEGRFVLSAPPAPSMPPGLVELMEDLSRNVLRNDPEDIFAFCAEHMRKLLVLRDGEETKPEKEKKPLNKKIENAIALAHKKAEKRKASYDRLLAESVYELGNNRIETDSVEENEDNSRNLNDDNEKFGGPLVLETEQISQTELNEERVSHDKNEDETKNDFVKMDTVISTGNEQSLNEGDDTANETKSIEVQAEKKLDVAINKDQELEHNKSNEGPIIIDPNSVFIENKQEMSKVNNCISTKSKDDNELEEVKKTVCDAIAEIETAAIKTVTNLTLNLGKSIQNNPQDHLNKLNYVSDEGHLNSASNQANINIEKDTIKESSTLQAEILNKSEINLSSIIKANSQAAQTMNSSSKTTKSLLDSSGKSLENIQEEMDAISDQNKASIEQSLIAQEDIHLQKRFSDLENIKAEKSSVFQPNDFQNGVDVTGTDKNNEQLIVQVQCHNENNIYRDSNLHTEQKELIDIYSMTDSVLNPIIKKENAKTDKQTILTEDTNKISHKENNDMVVDMVENFQNVPGGVIAITESLEGKTEHPKNSITTELVTENLKQNIAIPGDPLNKIKPILTEDNNIISHKENDDIMVDKVENFQNVSSGVIAITERFEIETELPEKLTTAELVATNLNPNIAIPDDPHNKMKPILTEDSRNISHKENNDMVIDKVENFQNVSDRVIVISESLESETELPEKLETAELVIENLEQNIAIPGDPLNKIKITVTENQLNTIDNTNDGEEEGTNNDLVVDLSSSDRSPRSLKSNDSGDTDEAANGTSAEASNSVDNSDNSANPTMDLETAAVTIQKVFRSFLFKSRASTIDDETPLDIPYMPDAIQDSDSNESIVKVEEEPRILNKERRNLGLSRMDTVLQTVNEEKSLSLSDDSSTLSSAATVIQAHVRGYLFRNKLNNTHSGSVTTSHTQSSELENDQHKNKTILNIHIVPEGSHFMSRDESLTLSLDLPLDTSPPSLTSYHSLGYDITERRKLLKREDAIQSSISPPSTNSGKSDELPITTNDIGQPGILDEHPNLEDKSESEEVKESEISGDTTPTVSTTAETVIEIIKEIELNSGNKESSIILNSEIEGSQVSTGHERDVLSEPQSEVYSGVMHSGEFHDVVLPPQPTRLSLDDPKHVAREFKAKLVYFLIWN